MIDLSLLKSFVIFAQHLNLTHAARALFISQPALHAQIQKLSEQLGVILYERRGNKLMLTTAGERVVGFAQELEEYLERFTDSLHQSSRPQMITLASGEGAFRYLLSDAIREFQQNEINQIRLLTLRGEDMERAVRLGQAHFAVTASESTEEGIERIPIAQIPMAVAMPIHHPLAQKKSLVLEDLHGSSLIVPPAGRPHRVTLELALRSANVDWEIAVEAIGWELSLHFVSLGIGLSIVNAFCATPEGVVMRTLSGLPSRTYFLVQREEMILSPNAEQFRSLIIEHTLQWR